MCLSCFFFLMIRRPPRSTHCISSAASDVYKRQQQMDLHYLIAISRSFSYSFQLTLKLLRRMKSTFEYLGKYDIINSVSAYLDSSQVISIKYQSFNIPQLLDTIKSFNPIPASIKARVTALKIALFVFPSPCITVIMISISEFQQLSLNITPSKLILSLSAKSLLSLSNFDTNLLSSPLKGATEQYIQRTQSFNDFFYANNS
eukprot:TRINITY_DN15113_c0_g1_i1.p1 TRINITY_DN15113_c0_g1~~TRINITY_DN15113_c0_g1_i1.p1  ORF type:complete len:202 (+),score=38.31 TRINITY_DN15113_c0_g1_i1:75-680(+)